MNEINGKENRILIDFWDRAFSISLQETEEETRNDPEDWKTLAPSDKLFLAACTLGKRKKVLDYGCGNAWAGITAAKSGCADVTAVDAAPGAIGAAKHNASLFCREEQIKIFCISPDWLHTVPSETYDGLICSNVLDVVPQETAEDILRESARIVTGDAGVIVGLNYYLSPEAAAEKGMALADGRRLYVNGVLRLVSRTDEEWTAAFLPYYSVDRLEHFAWPGEKTETRRLFYLKKRKI